jgi:hypothetical protein
MMADVREDTTQLSHLFSNVPVGAEEGRPVSEADSLFEKLLSTVAGLAHSHLCSTWALWVGELSLPPAPLPGSKHIATHTSFRKGLSLQDHMAG